MKLRLVTIAKFNCRFRSDNLLFQPATTSVRHDRKAARNRQLNLVCREAMNRQNKVHCML